MPIIIPNKKVLDKKGLDILIDCIANQLKTKFVSKTEFDRAFSSFVNDDLPDLYTFDIDNDNNLTVVFKTPEELEEERHPYGFELDMTQNEPDKMINYIGRNENYSPAYMDFDNNIFNYGDWENAWFIKDLKPCMLNYDGTVAYDLDKNDHTKKSDGVTPSDISNFNFDGNAMVGIPTIWVKVDSTNQLKPKIYFCRKKLDDDYHAYSHTDENGDIIPYAYMPMFQGVYYNNKLRSIAGLSPTVDVGAMDLVNGALANNLENSHIWNMEVYSDRVLINMLLLMITKHSIIAEKFGRGTRDVEDCNKIGGALSNKGMFWGSEHNGVKVFGIENWWGNHFRWIAGFVANNYVQSIKMTYGTYDGSTCVGYNFTGDGYITLNTIESGGCISLMSADQYGLHPKEVVPSASTDWKHYFGDCYSINTGLHKSAFVGGEHYGIGDGAFYINVYHNNHEKNATGISTSLSCKPLA